MGFWLAKNSWVAEMNHYIVEMGIEDNSKRGRSPFEGFYHAMS